MPAVFISAILLIGTVLAIIESTRAWGIKGGVGTLLAVGGLFGVLLKFPINGGAIAPLIVSLVIFRKAQTARMMAIALGDDEPEA